MHRPFSPIRTLVAACPAAVIFAAASPAEAHVSLVEPPARYDSSHQKYYPCGHPDNPDGAVTRTYEEGSTITVTWDEFIGHPGHFRVALSAEGDAALVDPTGYEDFYVAPNVLLDDIADPDGVEDHSVEITLPAGVTCEKCTLQLLQIMTDKMPWGPEGGNELYYQCADIAITPVGTPADTGGGSSSGGESTEGGEDSTDDGGAGTTADSVTAATTEGSGDDGTGTPPVGTTADGIDDGDDGGCGCRTDGGTAAPFGLGVLLLAFLRRRRPA